MFAAVATAYNFTHEPEPDPSWLSVVQHSHPLSASELGQYPRRYAHGLAFHTVICQGDRYLPWLQRRLEQARFCRHDLSLRPDPGHIVIALNVHASPSCCSFPAHQTLLQTCDDRR